MKKLSIYFTPTHASVTVVNGISRETSSNNMVEVINGMQPQDRAALMQFCQACLAVGAVDEKSSVTHFEMLQS
jgi:hypothetical protein